MVIIKLVFLIANLLTAIKVLQSLLLRDYKLMALYCSMNLVSLAFLAVTLKAQDAITEDYGHEELSEDTVDEIVVADDDESVDTSNESVVESHMESETKGINVVPTKLAVSVVLANLILFYILVKTTSTIVMLVIVSEAMYLVANSGDSKFLELFYKVKVEDAKEDEPSEEDKFDEDNLGL